VSALESALLGLANGTQPEPEMVSVTVKFTGPVADLEAVGFKAWTVIPSPDERPAIAAGPIPSDRLHDLAALPGVLYVEGSRPHRSELNVSVPEVQADVLHSRNPASKGAGVVVGIIDSGIDIDHRSFRNDDGTTRIRGIWDQVLGARPGTGEAPPARFPGPPAVGVEYTQADIDATLRNRESGTAFPAGTKAVRTVDVDGHGTHVAGIAAGDGSQNGNCRGEGVFVGVAPAADILVVKRSGDNPAIGQSTNLLHALDWMWNHPVVLGNPTAVPPVPPRPIVVNMSFGDNRGPHDGTSLVESGLDLFLLTNPGHAAVKSAGNEGDTNRHAQIGVSPNGTNDLTFRINPNETTDCHLELWFSTDDRLSVTLRGPVPAGGGARPTIGQVGPNTPATPFVVNPTAPAPRQMTVTITSRVDDPRNGACSVEMDFSTPAPVPPARPAPLLDGEYEIHLENVLNHFAIVDAYIDKGLPGLVFTSNVTRDGTLTVPGTAKQVITVGAYAQKSFLFFNWSGDLTSFSSFGPTRDGSLKPDIAAPGAKITSVKSQVGKHCCCDCCVDFYTDTTKGDGPFEGTSMAAPHATGVIALMLEKDPTLPSLRIKEILQSTAREPTVSHQVLPDDQWGAGRLSAVGAVDGVTGPNPITGPTPFAGPMPSITSPGPSPRAGPGADPRPVSELAAEMRSWMAQAPAAQHWAALVSRHFSEVRGLINHNKRVATCWHRMEGPRLLAALGPAMSGVGVLTIVDDSEALWIWRSRVARFLDMLERFGSAQLAADARSHRDLVLALELDDLAALLRAGRAA
jgi:subtilisin family serine protease